MHAESFLSLRLSPFCYLFALSPFVFVCLLFSAQGVAEEATKMVLNALGKHPNGVSPFAVSLSLLLLFCLLVSAAALLSPCLCFCSSVPLSLLLFLSVCLPAYYYVFTVSLFVSFFTFFCLLVCFLCCFFICLFLFYATSFIMPFSGFTSVSSFIYIYIYLCIYIYICCVLTCLF